MCALVAHRVLIVWFNCVLAFVHLCALCRHVLVVCPGPRWLRRRSPPSYQPLEPRISLKNHILAKYNCISLFGHVFIYIYIYIYLFVGVACGVVAVVRAMWFVQCAASAQARCHMYAANKTCRCDSRTLWQHHVAMALPQLILCVVCVFSSSQQQQQQ